MCTHAMRAALSLLGRNGAAHSGSVRSPGLLMPGAAVRTSTCGAQQGLGSRMHVTWYSMKTRPAHFQCSVGPGLQDTFKHSHDVAVATKHKFLHMSVPSHRKCGSMHCQPCSCLHCVREHSTAVHTTVVLGRTGTDMSWYCVQLYIVWHIWR